MILSIAWKNIWRNKLRSAVLLSAIAFGLAGTLFIIGLSQGFIDSRNEKIIQTELAHIQIHNCRYKENFTITDTISNIQSVENILRTSSFLKAYSERLKVVGMASTAYGSGGVLVVGIDPQREMNVTAVYDYLADSNSTYLTGRRENSILIGQKLAKTLQLVSYEITDNVLQVLLEAGLSKELVYRLDSIKGERFRNSVKFYERLEELLNQNEFNRFADLIADYSMSYKLGRKVVLRMQDVNGQVVEEAFRVVGVFDTQNDIFDGTYVFVKKPYLAQLLGLHAQSAHEIAMIVDDTRKIKDYSSQLQSKLPNLTVESMYDLDPILRMSKTMATLYYLIFEVFILFALSFGIVNTMLMAVLERTKELGMLMAIGMNKRRIFSMIMTETLMLTLTGGIIGMFLGYLIVHFTGQTGIDFSKYAQQGFQSIGYSPLIYPNLPGEMMFLTTLLVIFTGLVAAIYPALRALKLKPAEALQTK